MRKKRSIGMMRSIASVSSFGGSAVARDETLPERQEIEQELDQRRRVARDMPAVGQDLAVELLAERPRVALDHGLLLGDAEPGIDQRHQR